MSDKKKIGVAIVHGIGQPGPDFCDNLINGIKDYLPEVIADDIAFKPIHWSPVVANREVMLGERIILENRWQRTRQFFIEFLADALAYPQTDGWIYRGAHKIFAAGLMELSEQCVRNAPLCVISHSLGTVVSSNFMWDLQSGNFSAYMEEPAKDNAMARGQTLNLFYTMGSPLALWSLLHGDTDADVDDPIFGTPISVPPKNFTLRDKVPCEWINFYDTDDVIAYPLNRLNKRYHFVQDREIRAGNIMETWLPPLAHGGYWEDEEVIHPIGDALEKTWEVARYFE